MSESTSLRNSTKNQTKFDEGEDQMKIKFESTI